VNLRSFAHIIQLLDVVQNLLVVVVLEAVEVVLKDRLDRLDRLVDQLDQQEVLDLVEVELVPQDLLGKELV